ncbi:MAG TPA: hypothetical protein VJ921_06750 [Vicinamibacteria bacterium]|nr:hypothetical protein [Vicinamibacteria bacterium]
MSRSLVIALLLACVLAGCGTEKDVPREAPQTAPRPSGKGACALLMQEEIDGLFGSAVGEGSSESLEGGVELCTWPAGEDPALLFQIEPAASNVTAAVDLGEGYRTVEIEGMSGPAALSLEAGKETVAVLALSASDRTFTVSPIGLGIGNGSEKLEKLKALLELAATRPVS